MKVVVINGANLNFLGKRDNAVYGSDTLETLNKEISARAKELKMDVEFFQSNCEGAIIDKIQENYKNPIIINAGAYSHYSYAIADALRDHSSIACEVHLSNIYARDEFRAKSVLSSVCDGVISGLGKESYFQALEFIANKVK